MEHANSKFLASLLRLQGEPSLCNLVAKAPPPETYKDVQGSWSCFMLEVNWLYKVKESTTLDAWNTTNVKGIKPLDLFMPKHKNMMADAKLFYQGFFSTFNTAVTILVSLSFVAQATVSGGNSETIGKPVFLSLDDKVANKTTIATVNQWYFYSNIVFLLMGMAAQMEFVHFSTSDYSFKEFKIRSPCALSIGVLCMWLSASGLFGSTWFGYLLYLQPYGLFELKVFFLWIVAGAGFAVWFYFHRMFIKGIFLYVLVLWFFRSCSYRIYKQLGVLRQLADLGVLTMRLMDGWLLGVFRPMENPRTIPPAIAKSVVLCGDLQA